MPTRQRKHAARHLVRAFLSTPWAILPEKLNAICELVHERAAGRRFSKAEVRARIGGDPMAAPAPKSIGAVRILPLFGTICPRASLLDEISGGTSAERFLRAFKEAVADDNISAIVIDVDSPGGSVHGVDELSKAIYEARGSKKIVAVANHLCASAAYYIASAASEFVVTPSSEAGSIGVFLVHEDFSKFYEDEGVKPTLISAGKYKVEGNEYEPLSKEAAAALQERVDSFYGMFVDSVARNRGVSRNAVIDGFGQGRLVGADQAVASGMADRIATIDDVIQGLGAVQVSMGLDSAEVGRLVGQRNAAATSLPEENEMDRRIFAALFKAGLIELSASEERAQQVLNAVLVIKPAASNKPEDVLAAVEQYHSAAIALVAQPLRTAVATLDTTEPPPADFLDLEELNAMFKVAHLDPADAGAVQEKLTSQKDAITKRAIPLTHKRAYGAITEHLAAKQAATGPSIEVTQDSSDAFRAEAMSALLTRHWGQSVPKQVYDRNADAMVDFKPQKRNFQLMSLKGLARECLLRAGANPRKMLEMSDLDIAKAAMGKSPDLSANLGIRAYSDGQAFHTTGMFSNVFLDAANVVARRSYQESNTTFQQWMGRGPDVTDFKTVNRIITGEIGDPKAIPENGEFQEVTLTDGRESYPVVVWGETFSMTWQMMVNDQLGEFLKIPQKMANSMRRKQNKLAYQILKDNATMADGGALFNATAVTTAGGHANLITAGAAPSVATLNAAYASMSQQMGLNPLEQTSLGIEPRYIIAPPALRGTTMELLGSTSNPAASQAGITNIWENGLIPIFDPQLGSAFGGSDVWWFLAADPGVIDTIEYCFLQGYEAPKIESAEGFDRLALRYRGYMVFGVDAIDFRGLFENDGS